MRVRLGGDYGASSFKPAGFLDNELRFLPNMEVPSRAAEGPAVGLEVIFSAFERFLDESNISPSEVESVTLGLAGVLSAPGVLGANPNFGNEAWSRYELAEAIEQEALVRWSRPLTANLLHDGAALAVYEAHRRGDAFQNLLAITSGTGLGGGLAMRKPGAAGMPLVLRGASGRGMEIGHQAARVDLFLECNPILAGADPPECACGRGHCVELFGSRALLKWGLPAVLNRVANHALSQVPAPEAVGRVRDFAESGDSVCLDLFRAQAFGVGMAAANLNSVACADTIVVDGGLVNTTPELREEVLERIKAGFGLASGVFSHLDPEMTIELASDRDDRGTACGAALYAGYC
ncbi:MAG: ROK family protein [Bdellovibrionales bacterium]|nr:ROK family protein [Bdellovibrionales bacterium]